MLIITVSAWEKIRGQFSQEEKDKLNAAYCGEVVCPRGIVIDEEKIDIALLAKTRQAIAALR